LEIERIFFEASLLHIAG